MADEESSDQSSPGTCQYITFPFIFFSNADLVVITAKKAKKFSDDDETDEDDGKDILGSAGGIVTTTPQISRARILSEQKELSLKKRQNSTQKGQRHFCAPSSSAPSAMVMISSS
jgi:hypothetical protein